MKFFDWQHWALMIAGVGLAALQWKVPSLAPYTGPPLALMVTAGVFKFSPLLGPGEKKPPSVPPPLPIILMLLLVGCAADKPIVKANPEAANCILGKGIEERKCVRDHSVEAEARDCIAKVRVAPPCADGGSSER